MPPIFDDRTVQPVKVGALNDAEHPHLDLGLEMRRSWMPTLPDTPAATNHGTSLNCDSARPIADGPRSSIGTTVPLIVRRRTGIGRLLTVGFVAVVRTHS
jgi:hypothetical protein